MPTIVLDLSNMTEDEARAAADAQINAAINKTATAFANRVKAEATDLASKELKSTYETYEKALSIIPLGDNAWVVNLDDSATWIEDGTPERSGYDFLLNKERPTSTGKIHTTKEGFKWRVIPFEHTKAPRNQTQSAKEITTLLKQELKKKGIPFKAPIATTMGVTYDASGAPHAKEMPKYGLVDGFDIDSPKKGKGKFPVLSGVRIYQSDLGGGKTSRDIFTFRVISEKTKGDGRWQYKAQPPKNFLDRALTSVMDDFNEVFADFLEEAIKGGI